MRSDLDVTLPCQGRSYRDETDDLANPNLSIYSASKAAVIGSTKSAGKELATTGVLVNAIAPAVIATPMNDSTAPDVLAHVTSLIPMKRVGRPRRSPSLSSFSAQTG